MLALDCVLLGIFGGSSVGSLFSPFDSSGLDLGVFAPPPTVFFNNDSNGDPNSRLFCVVHTSGVFGDTSCGGEIPISSSDIRVKSDPDNPSGLNLGVPALARASFPKNALVSASACILLEVFGGSSVGSLFCPSDSCAAICRSMSRISLLSIKLYSFFRYASRSGLFLDIV